LSRADNITAGEGRAAASSVRMRVEEGPVSAVSASPAAKERSSLDPVRALQHALYRAAKADPGRRFHALWDKVWRRDVLWRAWVAVRRNNGAPGIDQTTLADVEEYGVARFLDEVAAELREGRYRPLPARRVMIPKPGTSEQRPLSIPSVRDRVVQAALKVVLEPVFEADFLPCSFGFRPRRSTYDALQVVIDEAWRGRLWVVETDIANCFEAIPLDRLMQAVQERVCDQPVLKLLRVMLRAGVMQDGQVRRPVTGTPQGGGITPPTHLATCLMVTLRVGLGCGLAVVAGSFPDGDAVADGDFVGSDEDVLDQQPQDASAFFGGRGVCLVVELGKECLQVVGEGEVCLAVAELGVQGVELVA
jgi:hypothetical protein